MGLLNRLGAFFYEKATPPPTENVGVGGAVSAGGYLQTNELSTDLIGYNRWRKTAEWKRNVAIVSAGLRRFLELLGSPKWSVAPFDKSTESVKRAEFANAQIRGMATPWRTVVQVAGLSRFDGFALQVWTAKLIAGGPYKGWYGLADVEARPPQTIEQWQLDPSGNVLGVVQRSPQTGEEIPIERARLVYSRDLPITDSPDGVGLMRHVAEPIREMQALRKQRNQGFETDLNGIPSLRAPIELLRSQIGQVIGGKTFTQADFDAAIDPLKKFSRNHVRTKETGIVLDSGMHKDADQKLTTSPLYSIELLKAGASSFKEMNDALRDMIWEIAIILGVEYLLTGSKGDGSLAMSTQKADDFYRLVIGTLNALAETFRRDLLTWLWILNGWDVETVPELTYDKLEFADVAEVVRSLFASFSQSGITLTRSEEDLELVNRVLAHYGLPPLAPEDPAAEMARREAAAAGMGVGARGAPKKDDGSTDITFDEDP